MQRIENRMVNDSVWERLESSEKLNGKGYYNPNTGIFVPEEDAFDYMIESLKEDLDKADSAMEHFYANWVKED